MSQPPSDQRPPSPSAPAPVAPGRTRVERLNARIRDNPVVAAVIVAGTIVIAVASFTDATTKLLAAVSKPSPAAARASLGQMAVPFTADAFVASARSGDAVAVKLFLVAGMDPSVLSDREGSALGNAAFAGQEKVVTLLLAAGARIESVGGHPSALASAASGGHNTLVRLMLDRHPGADVIDEAFVAAVRRSNAQTTRNDEGVRLLAANGANLKKLAAPALVEQLEHGYGDEDAAALTKTLLDLGADLGGSPADGGTTVTRVTPLMAAAAAGDLATVELLLSRNLPIDLRLDRDPFDGAGLTALMMATRSHRAAVATLLMKHQADIALKNGNGDDTLLIAAKQGDVETFRAVLDQAINLESANDRDGRTALLWLSAGILWPDGRFAVQADAIEALLDRGARVDAKDKEGRTALMLAARSGEAAAVRLLLAKGARVTDRDAAGLGPLEWARRGNDPVQVAEVARLLQAGGR